MSDQIEKLALKKLQNAKNDDEALTICRSLTNNGNNKNNASRSPTKSSSIKRRFSGGTSGSKSDSMVSHKTAKSVAQVCLENEWLMSLSCIIQSKSVGASDTHGALALAVNATSSTDSQSKQRSKHSPSDPSRAMLLSALLTSQVEFDGDEMLMLLRYVLRAPSPALIAFVHSEFSDINDSHIHSQFLNRVLSLNCSIAGAQQAIASLTFDELLQLFAHLRRRLTFAAPLLDEKPSSTSTMKSKSQRKRSFLTKQTSLTLPQLSLSLTLRWTEHLIDAHAHVLASRPETLDELNRVALLLHYQIDLCDTLAPTKGFLTEILHSQTLVKTKAVDTTPPYSIEILKL